MKNYTVSLIKRVLYLLIAVISCNNLLSESLTQTPQLQLLLDDMKLYKLSAEGDRFYPIYMHAGDLYEHSIWAYYGMIELIATQSVYTRNLILTKRQKEILALAALLHDIGKAGRQDLFLRTHPTLRYEVIKDANGHVEKIIYLQDNQEHTCVGFNYAIKPFVTHSTDKHQPKDYYRIDKATGAIGPFDMTQLYHELNLSLREQQIIAILLGMHYEFGNLVHGKITQEKFLQLLQEFVSITDYNQGIVDKEIVQLSILIQAADVKGITPVQATSTTLFPGEIICCATHSPIKFNNPFNEWGYVSAIPGQKAIREIVMDNLLEYFEQEYCEGLPLLLVAH